MSLWSGTGPSLVLAGNPAIQFMVYEAVKKFLMSEDKKVSDDISHLCCFPFFPLRLIGQKIEGLLQSKSSLNLQQNLA